MKIDGITLLELIRDKKIEDDTKIKVYYLGVLTKKILKYKNNEINWDPGNFRLSCLYYKDYEFEIMGKRPKKIDRIKNKQNKNEKINEIVDAVNYLLEKGEKENG